MSEYDGRIVIDSHIDTTRFDLDASKLFNKAKKLSDKLSINIKTTGINLGFNIDAIDNIIPKNLDKRINEITKATAELGKPIMLNEIPSKIDDITNSARRAAVQTSNLKNKLIDTVNALHLGEYSDKDKHTLLLSAERMQRELVRKSAIKPENILSIQDSNELNKLSDNLLSKLTDAEDVIKRFKDIPISKATGLDQAKADAMGVYKEFIKLQNEINKSESYLKELVNELIKLKDNAFDMDISEATKKLGFFFKEINNQNEKINRASIKQQALISGEVPSNTSSINLPDLNEQKTVFTALDKALLSMQDTLNKFSGFSISKDDSFGKIKSEIYGVSDEFNKLQSKITDSQVHIKTYLEKLNLLKSTFDIEKLSPDFDQNKFISEINLIIKGIEKYQKTIFKAKMEQETLFRGFELSGINNVSGSFKEVSKGANEVNNELNKLDSNSKKASASLGGLSSKASSTKNIFGNLGNSISKSFSGIGGIFSKAFSGVDGLFESITSRFRWIVLGQVIRAVINDAKQSITDLRTYSASFDNTMQSLRDSAKQVGNSIATAFAPALQALAPIIANVSMWLTDLFNKIAMFNTALFTGAKTAVIADTSFSGYAKSTKKATANTKKGTKAIKEQTSALAKFDKLDVFQKDKAKSPASAIADAAAEIPQAMKMFKTVEVPQNIINIANKLKEAFQPLADEFKIIGDSFQNNFVAPVVKHVKENILPKFLDSTRERISKMDFTKLNSSLDKFFSVMSKITKNIFDGLEWGWENVLLPIIDKTITDYLPKFLDALTSALNILNFAWQAAKPYLKTLVTWLKELADPLITGLLDGLNKTLGNLKWAIETICPPIENLGKALEKMDLHIPQWVKSIMNWIGGFIGKGGIPGQLFNSLTQLFKSIKEVDDIKYDNQKYKLEKDKLRQLTFGNKYLFQRRIRGFASGTVVSPNRRFLAMLGDNTSEQEVVSPVSTMKQAFMEAIAETGMQGGTGDVVLQLDGTTFARLMNPYNRAEQNRIGISMIEGVAY